MYEFAPTWARSKSYLPGVPLGSYVIVDDYGALENCRNAVHKPRSEWLGGGGHASGLDR